MPISEDFKPMTGKASFILPSGHLEIPADERVSVPLLNVALQCGVHLDRALATVRGVPQASNQVYASDLTTLYFATRIHGVTAAGCLLVAHGLGREAVHMERSQYEFFLKMFYYEHKNQEAVDFVDSIPKSAKEPDRYGSQCLSQLRRQAHNREAFILRSMPSKPV